MRERLRYRSWTIGAKTLVSHALLALFAIVFACVVAYALSFRYVQDQAMEELVAQAEYIASRDTAESDELVIPDEQTLELYQNITNSMVLYVNRDYLATHIGTDGDAAPGGPEFARMEIISSIDRQFVARIFEGESVGDIRRFEFASGVILFAGAPVRNAEGKVILYADTVTDSMERAITETERRRRKQIAYNEAHGITPKTIKKDIRDILEITAKDSDREVRGKDHKKLTIRERRELIERLTKEMKAASKMLEFEHAAYLRDRIRELEGK